MSDSKSDSEASKVKPDYEAAEAESRKSIVYGHVILAAAIHYFYGLSVEELAAWGLQGELRPPTQLEISGQIRGIEDLAMKIGATFASARDIGQQHLHRAMENVIQVGDEAHSLRVWINMWLAGTFPEVLILPINIIRNILEIISNTVSAGLDGLVYLEGLTGQIAYGTDPWYHPVITALKQNIATVGDNLTLNEAIIFGILAVGFMASGGPRRMVSGTSILVYQTSSMIDTIVGMMASGLTQEAIGSMAFPAGENMNDSPIVGRADSARSGSSSDVQLMSILQNGFSDLARPVADRVRRLSMLVARRTCELIGFNADDESTSSSTLASSSVVIRNISRGLPDNDPTNTVINSMLRHMCLPVPTSFTLSEHEKADMHSDSMKESSESVTISDVRKRPRWYNIPLSEISASSAASQMGNDMSPSSSVNSSPEGPQRTLSAVSDSSADIGNCTKLDREIHDAVRHVIQDLIRAANEVIAADSLLELNSTRGGKKKTRKNRKNKTKKFKKFLRKLKQRKTRK
jgi:hypothetical protein